MTCVAPADRRALFLCAYNNQLRRCPSFELAGAIFIFRQTRAMDWTPIIGRRRPVEQDALRVLTVVHRLGRQPAEDRWSIDTESQLRHLDHLVRHPIDLAYTVMDQVRERPALADQRRALARQVREVCQPRSLDSPARRRRCLPRPFDPGLWQRWDDVLAYLGCRDLLRIELLPASELRYLLTRRGAQWLRSDDSSPRAQTDAPYGPPSWRRRCDLLRDALPSRLLRPPTGAALGDTLIEIGRRLESIRQEEQIRLEEDLLANVFRTTFLEPL